MKWSGKLQGHGGEQWEPAGNFVHRITNQWVKCKRLHNISVFVGEMTALSLAMGGHAICHDSIVYSWGITSFCEVPCILAKRGTQR